MLVQFRFKNFKSFRDDNILDMSATKITEFADRVVSIGNEKLLTAAAIYGANASGKSNVIDAFRYMGTYVINSFAFGGDSDKKDSKGAKLKFTPFLFDPDSRDGVSLFEIYFIGDKEHSFKTFNYGFSLDRDGVVEEWLNSKAKTAKEYSSIFYRNRKEDVLDLSGIARKSQENISIALEKETLVVSLGAKLKIDKLKYIRDWFFSTNLANFGNPIENVVLSSVLPDHFVDDVNVQENVVKFISSFDKSIIGFDVEEKEKDIDGAGSIKIEAVHRLVGGGTASIPLVDESEGTQKMFALYQGLHNALENGSVLFIDELNARLHPLLVRNFILTFLNPEINKNHAQLIFTTHDSWQLANNLLRRDEIWFTEKDGDGVSVLYSLADFVDEDGLKIRKDESYEKNYLLGKYGAIPTLEYFDMFN